ncbi:hypothetical protein E3O19_09695 [Cryobacterium algoritolerans]|uniref:AbiEi antitoxin C-terminal domain-containing protein n=1 Tax=Cryobacterium algoritolerans TaxID=1259184 RepID=A0A4R8WUI1_9MICO|nr:hypothetical protein [Cryobacterium algoritolerans]TFC15367.1 hypothetical protein E3O19_09695 [Cryobacterium algoritolerans]
MTTRLRSVLSGLDLPVAELSSARLDGELFSLGDFWCAVDEPDGPLTRAQAAALLVPPRAIAERLTAAWIYGLAPEPRRHHFCVDVGARVHPQPSARLILREVTCPPADTVTIAGLRVTRPLRTLVDLARWPKPDVDVVPLIDALLSLCGPDGPEQALLRCNRAYVPFRRLALNRLAASGHR